MLSQKAFNSKSKLATFSPAGFLDLLVILHYTAFFRYFKDVSFMLFLTKQVLSQREFLEFVIVLLFFCFLTVVHWRGKKKKKGKKQASPS